MKNKKIIEWRDLIMLKAKLMVMEEIFNSVEDFLKAYYTLYRDYKMEYNDLTYKGCNLYINYKCDELIETGFIEIKEDLERQIAEIQSR